MGHSRHHQVSEGLCYEFHVRAPGLVAARQHYAAGSRTLAVMDRLGVAESRACWEDASELGCLPGQLEL